MQCVENVRGAKELCVCVSQNLVEAVKWLGNAFWDRKQEGKDMPTWVIAVASDHSAVMLAVQNCIFSKVSGNS